jgi:hypothetical protein
VCLHTFSKIYTRFNALTTPDTNTLMIVWPQYFLSNLRLQQSHFAYFLHSHISSLAMSLPQIVFQFWFPTFGDRVQSELHETEYEKAYLCCKELDGSFIRLLVEYDSMCRPFAGKPREHILQDTVDRCKVLVEHYCCRNRVSES